MNTREGKIAETIGRFFRIINKVNSRDRIPTDFGTGELLCMGEIHMIEAIGSKPGANVTAVAQGLGVTKGAVSQMVSRLAKKGYVRGETMRGGGNEVSLGLTAKGKTVYAGHAKYHAVMYASVFKGMTDEELAVLDKVLGKTEFQLDATNPRAGRKRAGV
ncbi:MAG: MarR family transcriptional regulator [Spirochaetes bacterium]|nr:MAG: MarR family transcriptional regulator [Spirochaetota bacterium]